jgi:tetratricopeptide (TPR) repeat protein
VRQAKDYFEQALDLDPAFARAWTGLGDAYSSLSALAIFRASDAYPKSRAAAERALTIDPDLPEAHVTLATPSTRIIGTSMQRRITIGVHWS